MTTPNWNTLSLDTALALRTAAAGVEGLHHDGKPTALFLCTDKPAGPKWPSDSSPPWPATQPSAGPAAPSPPINPAAIHAMAEVGIDISAEFPKPWTDETVRAADVVISIGCGDACPIFPGKRYESWGDLNDPAGLDVDDIRPIRDEIKPRVQHLLTELDVPQPALANGDRS
jgi:arsenate reductase (thioredoxin)